MHFPNSFRKTALQNHKLWCDFFPRGPDRWWRAEVGYMRSERERKVWHVQALVRSVLPTHQHFKPTRAVHNVHWSAGINSFLPAIVNQILPVEFKTNPQPPFFYVWHQWHNTGRVFITRDFLAIFRHLFDRVPVRNLTSNRRSLFNSTKKAAV